VIAQQLISYRQLSRLRKSATAARLSHRACTVSWVGWLWQLADALWSVVPLHTPDKQMICHWWCGPFNSSKADSDQNATGREWYRLSEAADFQVVRYQVVKLQGLSLVQNSFSDTKSNVSVSVSGKVGRSRSRTGSQMSQSRLGLGLQRLVYIPEIKYLIKQTVLTLTGIRQLQPSNSEIKYLIKETMSSPPWWWEMLPPLARISSLAAACITDNTTTMYF